MGTVAEEESCSEPWIVGTWYEYAFVKITLEL